jgi:hypothetical protein
MVMNKIGEGRHMLQMSTQGAKCEKMKGKPITLKRSSKCKTWRFRARRSPLGVGSHPLLPKTKRQSIVL